MLIVKNQDTSLLSRLDNQQHIQWESGVKYIEKQSRGAIIGAYQPLKYPILLAQVMVLGLCVLIGLASSKEKFLLIKKTTLLRHNFKIFFVDPFNNYLYVISETVYDVANKYLLDPVFKKRAKARQLAKADEIVKRAELCEAIKKCDKLTKVKKCLSGHSMGRAEYLKLALGINGTILFFHESLASSSPALASMLIGTTFLASATVLGIDKYLVAISANKLQAEAEHYDLTKKALKADRQKAKVAFKIAVEKVPFQRGKKLVAPKANQLENAKREITAAGG